jgi:hypothetical protein
LISLEQGKNMKDSHFDPDIVADSVLFVKASGSINDDIINDLLLDNGKSIAELINEQKKDQTDT